MNALFKEPAGREARPAWKDVPSGIVAKLEALLKEKIAGAETAWGGYSPSAAFVATLASGKKVFIKGTHPGQDTHGAKMLEEEVSVYQHFAEIREFSPAYIGTVSDGQESGWMLAVFEYADKTATLPWTEEKTGKAVKLLARLHACQAPALIAATEKNFVGRFLQQGGGWLRLQGEATTAAKFLTLFEDAEAGKKWLQAALPVFCDRQKQAPMIGGPQGVLHQDLRSDNFLFSPFGRVYLVDWPNACRGPVVLDVVQFISSVAAESAFAPTTLLEIYERMAGMIFDRQDLARALAALSGYMADNAYRAVPEKLPRLRWMQTCTLWAMLQWAHVLMKTPLPPRFKGMADG